MGRLEKQPQPLLMPHGLKCMDDPMIPWWDPGIICVSAYSLRYLAKLPTYLRRFGGPEK